MLISDVFITNFMDFISRKRSVKIFYFIFILLDIQNRSSLRLFEKLFQLLIMSNQDLINNKDNNDYPMYFSLIYGIFLLQNFYSHVTFMSINIEIYKIMFELLLFIIEYHKEISHKKF